MNPNFIINFKKYLLINYISIILEKYNIHKNKYNTDEYIFRNIFIVGITFAG
jgi:hypothetical protein